jgi:hypothetical protein
MEDGLYVQQVKSCKENEGPQTPLKGMENFKNY